MIVTTPDLYTLTYLDLIRTCDNNNKFIIFSGLKAMNHASSNNPQIQKLLENVTSFKQMKKLFSVGFLVI